MLRTFLLLAMYFLLQDKLKNNASAVTKIAGRTVNECPSKSSLIFEETFEEPLFFPLSGKALNKTHSIENCKMPWTLSRVSSPVFRGEKACRFEVRKNQPLVGSSQRIRSEVVIIKPEADPYFTPELWYSFSIFFPSVGFEYDDKRDCINQWYEDGTNETTIRAKRDKVYLEVTPAPGTTDLMKYDLFSSSFGLSKNASLFCNIPKDEWHEFVFHFIHSKNEDGLIEVWKDGIKIHHIRGRNMHLKYPKWKIGLYNPSFLFDAKAPKKFSELNSRVIYFDNIRIGKASSTLADMSSD